MLLAKAMDKKEISHNCEQLQNLQKLQEKLTSPTKLVLVTSFMSLKE